MLKLVTVLSLMLAGAAYSQPASSPYPVIFVHGLNSDDQTWNTPVTALSQSWQTSSNSTLHAVLNARGGDTTSFQLDVLMLLRDAAGNEVNYITPSNIYRVNFGNFWNRNPGDPRIVLYSNALPGSSQSPGNQSAITKQAYALSIVIDSVLRVTGADKVILAGHSMGGLAIREYLQRRENGVPRWWVVPGDTLNGHKVAKVVTTGTPHLGTNVTSIPLFTIDNASEAMRDMRITYPGGQAGAFLFSNSESNVTNDYYNRDINCNNSSIDLIAGISSGNTFNSLLPLPQNINYTWINSNYLSLGTDLAVPTGNQWLRNGNTPAPAGLADTLFNRNSHLQQTSDTRSIIRGLDEPDRRAFAYDVDTGKKYAAFVTLQSNGITSDTDFYRVELPLKGRTLLSLESLNAGVTSIALLNSQGVLLASKSVTGNDSLEYAGADGELYARIIGSSNLNSNQNSHRFTVRHTPFIRLSASVSIEAMWNGSQNIQDTVLFILRSSAPPYAPADSAKAFTDILGNSSAEFRGAQAGSYYVQIEHRNGLETWSSAPLNFTNGSQAVLDLTASQNMAYGGNTVLREGRWCIYSGDVNDDDAIDLSDLSLIDNDTFAFVTGYTPGDLDGNGFVDVSDLAFADNNAAGFVTAIVP